MRISFKEYAKLKGVSYEYIRRTVKENQKDIEAYTIKQGRQTFLTDEAIKILDAKLDGNKEIKTVVLADTEALELKEKEISELKAEYEAKLKDKDQEIFKRDNTIIELQKKYNEDKAEYLEKVNQFLEEKNKLINATKELEQKDTQLLLALTSRKERKRLKKELKKNNKINSIQ